MPWIVFRNLLMLLVAMALSPLQGFAAHSQSQSVGFHQSLNDVLSVTQSESESVSENAPQTPTSQSHLTQDAIGIVSTSRWSNQFRKTVDDENSSPDSECSNPFYTNIGYAYSLIDTRWLNNQSTFNHFSSNHRLSGWKDSNAMYVALNSQFSS